MADNNWFFNNLFKKSNLTRDESLNTNQIATEKDDGAIEISDALSQYAMNLSWTYQNQAELINIYRETAAYSVVDFAIEDIVNEAVSFSDDEASVTLDLSNIDKSDMSDNIKDKVYESYDKIFRLLDLDNTIHRRLKNFYVDGRLAYQKVVSKDKLREGIKNIIELDSRFVTKVRNVQYDPQTRVISSIDEHFIYDESPVNTKKKRETDRSAKITQPMQLDPAALVYVTSGLTDSNTGYAVSWLHKAVRPANQQRMMENALVIYRIVRAPERRMFYVDVSNLTKTKAEQYIKNLKNSYRNKMSFNPESGKFDDERHLQTMQEDYWLPRTSTGKGTEVSTLAGGDNLGQIEDVLYFQKELYKALNIPISRLEPESMISMGRSQEISRDELKFSKLVSKIRKRFNMMFIDLLRTEVVLTNVMSAAEFDMISQKIKFIYSQDMYIEEMKKTELARNRLDLAKEYEPHVGKYVSNDYIRKEVLYQTEQEVEDQDKLIEQEKKIPKYKAEEENNTDNF